MCFEEDESAGKQLLTGRQNKYGGDLMRKFFKGFNAVLNVFSSTLLVFLMLMTVIDVVLRKWFNMPISGSFELTQLALSLIVLFGFGYANDFKEHVVIDIFYNKFNRNMKKFCSIVCVVLTLVVSGVMTFVVLRQGLRMLEAYQAGTGSITFSLRIPMWPFAVIGSVGFFGFFLSALNDFMYVIFDKEVLTNDPN